ncbi:inner membrane protein [Klebsiella pneumoniae]|uniref:Inner membrane protein n=1 Tax=Klebsiella pneumoniae TaxID=573 RepID=A0A2X3CWP2_KLEPN|nr:inner membrane protein [Klebsiella pneumoniae]
MRRRCCFFSVALATTFYEGAHFAGMARVLGVAFAVFLAWRKVPLIGVIIARRRGDRAAAPGGYKLKKPP